MSYLLDVRPSTVADIVYLNSVHEKVRARAEYVGCVNKQYLIFRMPKTRDKRNLLSLNPGTSLMIRVVTNSIKMDFVSFSTTVQSLVTFKEKLLLVDFPKSNEVKLTKLRAQPRIPVELLAELSTGKDLNLLALVTDFSASGCKCECLPLNGESIDFDEVVDELIEQDAKLSFKLDSLDEKDINVQALVKNATSREKLHLGIKFSAQEQNKINTIYSKLLMENQGCELE